jgi:hypothetical protein
MDAIRAATPYDVPAMVALSEKYRRQLEADQPLLWRLLWRQAEGSAEAQADYFRALLRRDEALVLVHSAVEGLAGFLVATLQTAPPVYAPGGPTCLIDDFCMAEGRYWPKAGAALLAEAMRRARERGAVQVVVICPHHDQAKLALLAAEGLTLATEWHTRPL